MKRLQLLDYGRFFAAIYVVLFHYTFHGINSGKITTISYSESLASITKYGYLGVELFFMISGYVIFFSARNRTASQFAVARATRLYPAFWFGVIFTASFAYLWGEGKMSVSLPQVLTNLTMMPSLLGANYVDGAYWTLLIELKFYLLVFVLISVGLQKRLDTFFLAWPFLMAVVLLGGVSFLPFLGGYYYFFAAGAVFALAKEKITLKVAASLLTAFFLCVNYAASQAAHLTESKGVEFSGVTIGLIISLFFVFFLVLNSEKISQLELPKSALLGALTYPVYLIHGNFGYMFISRYGTEQNKLIIYSATMVIVFVVAYLMHSIIEVRYGKHWKSLFQNSIGRLIDFLQHQTAYLKETARDKIKVKKV